MINKNLTISKTILFNFVKINLQKRFYPQVNVNSNVVTQGVRVLFPRLNPYFSGSVPCAIINIPRSTTILSQTFSLPKILYHKSYKTINQNSFNENPILENALSILVKSKQPFSDKPQNLKTFTNKNYETYMTQNTTVNDLTEEQLKEELLKRELIKPDDGKTAIIIKLEDGTNYLLGSSKNKIKLSSLGQAYFEKINQSSFGNKTTKDLKFDISKLRIIVPPEHSSDSFIETGKQKHLIAIFDDQGNFFGLCYLTSKSSGVFMSDIQFKKFQDQKEGVKSDSINSKDKTQRAVFFDNFVEIDKSSVKYVKRDLEYLNDLPEEVKEILQEKFDEIKINPTVIIDTNGITKEVSLNICKEHDKIAQAKEKDPKGKIQHPLSKDQIKQNEQNKIAQQMKSATNNNETFS